MLASPAAQHGASPAVSSGAGSTSLAAARAAALPTERPAPTPSVGRSRSPRASGGGASGATPKAASKAKANKTGTRGRPRKNFVVEVEKLAAQFQEASAVDPMWFGAEAKTQLKILRHMDKEICARLKTVEDLKEHHDISVAQKKLLAIISLVEGVDSHGVDSAGFQKVWVVGGGGRGRTHQARPACLHMGPSCKGKRSNASLNLGPNLGADVFRTGGWW